MRTKRFVGRMVMIAVLATATAGVMPAGACNHCRWSATVPNTEQSSTGNPFQAMWGWLESFVASIL